MQHVRNYNNFKIILVWNIFLSPFDRNAFDSYTWFFFCKILIYKKQREITMPYPWRESLLHRNAVS